MRTDSAAAPPQLDRVRRAQGGPEPTLTVVLPTREDVEVLVRRPEASVRPPGASVLVVDDSTDGTADVIASLSSTLPTGPGSPSPRDLAPVERARREGRSPRLWLIAAACGLLTTAIGVVGLGVPSLWYDESASLSAAGRPLTTLPALLEHVDLVHGLYYVFLHGWSTVFGTGAVALRSPSAIALGVACAGCVVIAAHLGGRAVALVAGTTFALLPGLTWSATEAREWSLATAAVTWATAALLYALAADRRRWWAGYVLLMVLSITLSVMTVLMAGPHLWLAWRAGRLRRVALAGTVAGTVTLPLLLATSTQRGQVAWIELRPSQVLGRVAFDQLFTADQNVSYAHERLVGLALAGLFVVAGAATLAGRRRGAGFGAVWVAVPTALLAVPVVMGVQLYQDRYLTFAAPGAVLLVAEGVVVLARWTAGRAGLRALLAVGVLVAVAASATALTAQRDPAAKSGDDYRVLAAAARGADQVLYERPDARGIRLAYPRDFAGVTDVLLTQDPAESGTLWGTERGSDTVRPGGAVIAYVSVDRPRDSEVWLVRFLREQGCSLEDRTAASRWAALRWSCP